MNPYWKSRAGGGSVPLRPPYSSPCSAVVCEAQVLSQASPRCVLVPGQCPSGTIPDDPEPRPQECCGGCAARWAGGGSSAEPGLPSERVQSSPGVSPLVGDSASLRWLQQPVPTQDCPLQRQEHPSAQEPLLLPSPPRCDGGPLPHSWPKDGRGISTWRREHWRCRRTLLPLEANTH